ncbi:unnamed protein product [Oikopleura dioica]|uniref:SGF29 C-terminal domain-containing protein n=1 Tax=Oikopleura dioica TaxID=34765 RepID=E4WWA1_OIKDI|nr:unnamed protein product [Oikopleura dioica]
MYKLEKRIKLEQDDNIENANKKIDDLHHTLHTSICHINSLHNMSKLGLQDLEEARTEFKKNFAKEKTVTPSMKEDVGEKTRISIEETEAEITAIRNALDVIQNIRALQEERKLLSNEPRNTRRGVLMAQLQEAAKCTPLWIGGPNDCKPPLCGALPAAAKHEIVVGSKVAAKVDGAGENEPPNWILAKFVSYDSANMCTVEDIDAVDLTKAKISLNRKRVLPLPQWRANPSEDGDALHSEGSTVMALYPQTTCFYKGVVASIPEGPSDNYIVLFEDATYPNGMSPPMQVAQKYILAFDNKPDKNPSAATASTSKKGSSKSGSKAKSKKDMATSKGKRKR